MADYQNDDTGPIGALPACLRPMETAPRDGTVVLVFETAYEPGCFKVTRARVVMNWVTDEFIPHFIAADDSSGLNHGAIPAHCCLGWLPIQIIAEHEGENAV